MMNKMDLRPKMSAQIKVYSKKKKRRRKRRRRRRKRRKKRRRERRRRRQQNNIQINEKRNMTKICCMKQNSF